MTIVSFFVGFWAGVLASAVFFLVVLILAGSSIYKADDAKGRGR